MASFNELSTDQQKAYFDKVKQILDDGCGIDSVMVHFHIEDSEVSLIVETENTKETCNLLEQNGLFLGTYIRVFNIKDPRAFFHKVSGKWELK